MTIKIPRKIAFQSFWKSHKISRLAFSIVPDMVGIGCCVFLIGGLVLTTGFISIFSLGAICNRSSLKNPLIVWYHPESESRSLTCLVLNMYVHGWTTLKRNTSVIKMKTRSQECLDEKPKIRSIQTRRPVTNSTAHARMLVCKPIMFDRCLLCLCDSSKACWRYSAFDFLNFLNVYTIKINTFDVRFNNIFY